MDKIREEVLKLLKDINEDLNYEEETILVGSGLIDSMQVMNLVTEICDVFNVEIDADDVNAENFNSLDDIVNMIKKY